MYVDRCRGQTWASGVDISGCRSWREVGERCGLTWGHIVDGAGHKLWGMVVGCYGQAWTYCCGHPDYFVEDQNCGSPAPSSPETRGDPSVFLGAQDLVASWGHTHNIVAMSAACYGQVLWLHAVGICGTMRWTSVVLTLWSQVGVREHPLLWSHMDICLDAHSVHVIRRIMLGHITGPRSVQVGASRQVC